MSDAAPRAPLTQAEVLAQFPEVAGLSGRRGLLESFAVHTLRGDLDRVLAATDTSALNRHLGLPEMRFEERDGRLHGSAVYAGVHTEWEEVPWQWEYRRRLHTARLYSRGIAHLVHVCLLLEPLPPAEGTPRCRFYVYFCWQPRGAYGWLVLWLGTRGLPQRYGEAVQSLVDEAAPDDDGPDDAPPAGPPSHPRLAAAREALLSEILEAPLVDRLLQHLEAAPEEEVTRLRVRELARRWDLDPRRLLLLLFLHATRTGILNLTWDVVCPHCRGVRRELSHLGDLPERDACEVCEIDFETQGLDAFEVTFHLHPSVRAVTRRLSCSAEPARKPHIKAVVTLGPGESRRLPSRLGAGRYRLRRQGDRAYTVLRLDRDITADTVRWDGAAGEPMEAGPRPVLESTNPEAEARTFVVEESEHDRDALRPAELFRFQAFRDLFSEEALAAGIELDVGEQTLLFTDIVGSSRLYRERGDQGAFAQVRRQFTEIYEEVAACDGAVAKTIGDAAMAAFTNPADAVRCAVALQRRFAPGREDLDLRIRVSVHTGRCLAVNLNSGIDYFGDTVNLCAKIQMLVEAGEVALTRAVLDDAAARDWLEQEGAPLTAVSYRPPWEGPQVEVLRFGVTGAGLVEPRTLPQV